MLDDKAMYVILFLASVACAFLVSFGGYTAGVFDHIIGGILFVLIFCVTYKEFLDFYHSDE